MEEEMVDGFIRTDEYGNVFESDEIFTCNICKFYELPNDAPVCDYCSKNNDEFYFYK